MFFLESGFDFENRSLGAKCRYEIFLLQKMVLIELAQNTTSIVGKMPHGKLEKYYETNWKRKKEAEPLYNGSKIVPLPNVDFKKRVRFLNGHRNAFACTRSLKKIS